MQTLCYIGLAPDAILESHVIEPHDSLRDEPSARNRLEMGAVFAQQRNRRLFLTQVPEVGLSTSNRSSTLFV
jgi:hypothetical protein